MLLATRRETQKGGIRERLKSAATEGPVARLKQLWRYRPSLKPSGGEHPVIIAEGRRSVHSGVVILAIEKDFTSEAAIDPTSAREGE